MSEKKEEKSDSSDRSSDISQMEVMGEKKGFPRCIFFILGNEFCERYSFYGMRTILVLYLKYYLKWDDNTSTSVYHAFTVLAYLFPLFGAMIADSWWGKYKTILILSIVYSIGMVINTLGAIGSLGNLTVHAVLSSIGLFIIAFGTGGIKPCVSAFGGDQFDVDQEEYRRSFFSLFYFAINAGSLISTFVSPLIREEVQCFGGDCYALAFGIPAILMVVAILLFVVGSNSYKKYPPQGNVFLEVSRTVVRAIRKRFNTSSSQRDKDHWLDYADDGTSETSIMIRDIKYVFNVLVLFIPLPLFWALFDQQGSRWTLQAIRMDGYVGSLHVLPDQMQICNPLMIVTLIPLFEVTLYPCLRKLNINFSPLRRMTAGMLLAGLSFIVAALIQMKIDENLTKTPYNMQQTSLRIINSADCTVSFSSDVYLDWDVEEGGSGGTLLIPAEGTNTTDIFVEPGDFVVNYRCLEDDSADVNVANIKLVGKEVFDFVISRSDGGGLQYYFGTHPTEKSDSGDALIGMINTLSQPVNYTYSSGSDQSGQVSSNSRGEIGSFRKQGPQDITLIIGGVEYIRSVNVKTGGLYTVVVRDSDSTNDITEEDLELNQYVDIYHNDVSIFWLIPQYFIITLGEVFLSVTGLEFAYSQAPPSMKSVLTSFWLFTVSIGNIIVLIVAEARLIPKQVDEYFLFAGLIGAASVLFIALAYFYEYVDESEFADTEEHEVREYHDEHFNDESSMNKEDLGKYNEAFAHNTEL